MQKRIQIRMVSLFLAVFLLVTSCADLIMGTNLFSGFDEPPNAADALRGRVDASGAVLAGQEAAFLRNLRNSTTSNKFFANLSNDERTQLNTALKSIYSNGDLAPELRQQAALDGAAVSLRGTTAQTTTNNLTKYIADGGGDVFSEPDKLLDAIIPSSAKGDPVAIQGILDSYIAAATAYEALGETLVGGTAAPGGANMNSVGQNAAVAMAVAALASKNDNLAEELTKDPADRGALDTSGLDGINDDGTPLNAILQTSGLGEVFNGGD
jgi:hypothetical protein